MPNPRICQKIKKNGEKCKAKPLKTSPYCAFHASSDAPVIAAKKKAHYDQMDITENIPRFINLSSIRSIKRAYRHVLKAGASKAMDRRDMIALLCGLKDYVSMLKSMQDIVHEDERAVVKDKVTVEMAKRFSDTASKLSEMYERYYNDKPNGINDLQKDNEQE